MSDVNPPTRLADVQPSSQPMISNPGSSERPQRMTAIQRIQAMEKALYNAFDRIRTLETELGMDVKDLVP